VVAELCRLAGWTFKHEMIPKYRPEVIWKRIEGVGNRYEFTTKGANNEKEKLSQK
jgi:hypothetical protein